MPRHRLDRDLLSGMAHRPLADEDGPLDDDSQQQIIDDLAESARGTTRAYRAVALVLLVVVATTTPFTTPTVAAKLASFVSLLLSAAVLFGAWLRPRHASIIFITNGLCVAGIGRAAGGGPQMCALAVCGVLCGWVWWEQRAATRAVGLLADLRYHYKAD